MGLGRSAYNLLFRRTSTFLVTILFGAVVFERAFDQGADRLWGRMNKGVSVYFWLFCSQIVLLSVLYLLETLERPSRKARKLRIVYKTRTFFLKLY